MPILRHRAIVIAALLCAEVLLLTFVYQFLVTLDCQATGSETTCRLLRSSVARAMVMFAAVALLVSARPGPFRQFLAEARGAAGRGGWMALHLGGMALLLLPVGLGLGQDMSGSFALALLPWSLGGVAATVGGVLWIAPPQAWGRMLAQDRALTLLVLMAAALVPDLAEAMEPLWDLQAMTALTIAAVRAVLATLAQGVEVDAAQATIGVGGFVVRIARECSGVEGIALVTVFAGLYAVVFRSEIRLKRYLMVVLPMAILFSWALNVVRIAALILIGAHLSPEVALNSFHSYAGWLFFTLVAVVMIWGVQSVRWLHHASGPVAPPQRLSEDPVALQILPFVAFMLAGVVTGAMFPHPELGYPVKVVLLTVVVLLFLRGYRRIDWRPDGVAVLAGLVVGALWLALDRAGPDPEFAAILSQLPEADQRLWTVFRVAGTVLLVPLIEEMFFRGYIQRRLDRGGLGWRVAAIALSSLLFGALHGRWLLAGLAGVVFSLILLRRGRISDAVWAHMAANLVVALGALWLNDWARL